MNDIERIITDLNDQWRAGFRAGVEAGAKKCEYIADGYGIDSSVRIALQLTARDIRSLLNESDQDLVDEDEPDRYLDEIPRSEDERLDDPRHDQCRNGKFVP